MRISFRHADFQALAQLWNSFYPSEFAMDAELLRQNTVESPLFDWGASQIDVIDDRVLGFIAVKKSAASLYYGPNPDAYHISALAYTEADAGIDLLAQAKRIIFDRGASALHFGSDSRHFFPGCPTNAANLRNFLMVAGFEEGGECCDLERDLSDYESPYPPVPGVDYRVMTGLDLAALTQFFISEFPYRWKYDVLDKIAVEGPSCVMTAFQGERCIGFALIQDNENRQPIGGGVWRSALGNDWGSLGPIGVAKDIRGGGFGHGILTAGLIELKKRGVRRCIIDWTTLVEFYGKHGFQPTRHYVPEVLKFESKG